MKYSLTQGGILVAVAGTLLTQVFTEGCSEEIISNIPLVIGGMTAWIGRFRKGDVTPLGFRR